MRDGRLLRGQGMRLLVGASYACVALSASGANVASLTLGWSGYSPPVMHGWRAFDRICVTFDADVHVDAYDLQLFAFSPAPYAVAVSSFSYNSASRTAAWIVTGQPTTQRECFRAVVSGVWDSSGAPLEVSAYTNDFTILTGDVNGDDQVTPTDVLLIINQINTGTMYAPALDVDGNGVNDPQDVLIVINILNGGGATGLPPLSEYGTVAQDPPPALDLTGVDRLDGWITVHLTGMPADSLVLIEGKEALSDKTWYPIRGVFATKDLDRISFAELPKLPCEFYRASFR